MLKEGRTRRTGRFPSESGSVFHFPSFAKPGSNRTGGSLGFRFRRVGWAAMFTLIFIACPSPSTEADRPFDPQPGVSSQFLTLAERVACTQAVYEVFQRRRESYMRRRWGRTPPPRPVRLHDLRRVVDEVLRWSVLLEERWGMHTGAAELTAEMKRMAKNSHSPGVLRELFTALDHDPYRVAECLVRPFLVTRWVHEKYAADPEIHGPLRDRARRFLAQLQGRGTLTEAWVAAWARGRKIRYTVTEWRRGPVDPNSLSPEILTLEPAEWSEGLKRLAVAFGRDPDTWSRRSGGDRIISLPTGVFSPLQEDETRFFSYIVWSHTSNRLRFGVLEWVKEPFSIWWERVRENYPRERFHADPPEGYHELPSLPAACSPQDSWNPTTLTGAPSARSYPSSVWTGAEVIVWGGYNGSHQNTGGRYYPAVDSWLPIETAGAPSGRSFHAVVWTGSEMIVWGGIAPSATDTGGRYDPVTDTWQSVSTTDAPSKRYRAQAVWTGNEMIVWGGWGCEDPPTCSSNDYLNTGGRYDPAADAWSPMSTTQAPAGRSYHTAVWTGSEMIVWGGLGCVDPPTCSGNGYLNTGGRYDPGADTWQATTLNGAPSPRRSHVAVWTGSAMLIWAGRDSANYFGDGFAYDPAGDGWTPMSNTGAPYGREYHTGVWTGSEMIVWGGYGCDNAACSRSNYQNTGGRYNPTTDSWTATTTAGAPVARRFHTASMTSEEMVVWGGSNGNYLNSGGRYCVLATTFPYPVPDGRWVSGNAMTAAKSGSAIHLTWDVSGCDDPTYNILYGVGSDLATYSLSGAQCDIGTSGEYDWDAPPVPPGEHFIWWVIVGTDGGATESSWGRDSNGGEMSSTPSGYCGVTDIDTTVNCP